MYSKFNKKLPDILDILEFRCWRVGTLKKKKIKKSSLHHVSYRDNAKTTTNLTQKDLCPFFFSPPFYRFTNHKQQ